MNSAGNLHHFSEDEISGRLWRLATALAACPVAGQICLFVQRMENRPMIFFSEGRNRSIDDRPGARNRFSSPANDL